MALGGEDVLLVDLASVKKVGRLHPPKGAGKVQAAAFSANGATLLAGGSDHILRFWETASSKCVREIKTTHYDFREVGLSADGKTFFSLGGPVDATLLVWDSVTAQPMHRRSPVRVAAYAPDRVTVIAAVGQGEGPGKPYSEVIAYEMATGRKRTLLKRESDSSITALALSPDGWTLAAAGYNDEIRLWDIAHEKQIQRLPWVRGPQECPWVRGPVMTLAFSSDGRTLAAGGWGNTVRLWDWRTGKEWFDEGHQAGVVSLALTPHDTTVISQGLDETIRLWELTSRKEVHRISLQKDAARADAIFAALALPDGQSVVLSTWAGALRILDLRTGKERRLKNPPAGSTPAAASPDGKFLLTVPSSALQHPPAAALTCTLWDLARGEPVRRFAHAVPNTPKVDGASIVAAAFAPDGRSFAAAWISYRYGPMYVREVGSGVSVWGTATGKDRLFATSAAHLAFLDEGKTLVCLDGPRHWADSVGRRDKGIMQFWDVATGKLVRERQGPPEWGHDLVFSPDSRLFASVGCSGDPMVYFWRTATGRQVQRFPGHRCAVQCLAFSPDGRMLASGNGDTTILLWEALGLR
jgi:WD40 repeat protein